MLKTCEYHSFIQRPHFSQIAKNLFRASFFTPADIAAYITDQRTTKVSYQSYGIACLQLVISESSIIEPQLPSGSGTSAETVPAAR